VKERLIIEARVNEYALREVNAKVPWTPAEIARDAAECRAAGAAIVHFHAREGDGSPSHVADTYGDCIAQIRTASDILVHPTLGYVSLDAPPEERVGHVVALAKDSERRPDFAPMDMGSANVDRYDAANGCFRTTDLIYKNSTATLHHFSQAIAGAGLKPYLVSWNIGFTRQALAFMELGWIERPAFMLFVLTDGEMLAGHPGTPDGLDAHLHQVPDDPGLLWSVCNYGGEMLSLVDKIITAGGHIAIGLGDHHYDEIGCPSNAELIARVADRAQSLGRDVATPDETRAILAMRT
jgi:3-keto-5-aminohexanoate cleavage enzyme